MKSLFLKVAAVLLWSLDILLVVWVVLNNLPKEQIVFPEGNKVVYSEKNEDYSLDEFSRQIRLRTLSNMEFVVKRKPEGCRNIDGVAFKKLSRDDYSLEIYCDDRKKVIKTTLENQWVWIKFDEAYNDDSFLWDDALISWWMSKTDPKLSESTLDFWYSLQIEKGTNKGLIVREVRPWLYENSRDKIVTGLEAGNELSYNNVDGLSINNPFFLGRVELEIFKVTKDKERLTEVLPKLELYFQWLENRRKVVIKGKNSQEIWMYQWSNLGSGMDNICRSDVEVAGYSDLIAQQAASARDLEYVYREFNNNEKVEYYRRIYEEIGQQIRDNYYDENDGFVHDLNVDGVRIKGGPRTIAFVWSLYAGVLNLDQADKMIGNYLWNKAEFGGVPKFPALSESSIGLCQTGHYWNGGVFPSMVWFSIMGMEESGKNELVNQVVAEYYKMFMESYYSIGSICEYYNRTLKNGQLVCGEDPPARRNFHGWGSIPIGLFGLTSDF